MLVSRPSPRIVRQLYNIQLNSKKKLPSSIWPQKTPSPNPNPNLNPPIISSQTLAQFIISGHGHDPYVAGELIKHLSSLSPHLAVALFSLLPNPDAFISNTIIRSLLSRSQFDKALSFYRDLVANYIPPNNFTFPLLSKLFSQLGLHQNGILMHSQILKLGLEVDLYIRNGLIHMYSCFGDLRSSWKLFEGFVGECSDLITWNSMVDGCVKNGMLAAARELFDEMPERDLFSWNVMIGGYARNGMMDQARELFDEMTEKDVVTWNSMVDGYGKVGDADCAREFFDRMPRRSLVSWNVILAVCVRAKEYGECLRLFDSMVAIGEVRPNKATFVSVLSACGKVGDLERGKWVHSLIRNVDVLLLTSLLTMYAKCGAMEEAKEVFDEMPEKNAVTWNSMIMGYGMHGRGVRAVELFFEMERSGIQPNEKTFVCILSACVHGGLVVEGWCFFERMVKVYDIDPKVEHIGCMVDLLGRAGLLKDSEDMVKRVKGDKSKALWGALMSASRAHSDLNLGEIIGKRMTEMEPRDVGPYVLLSNIYAAQGKWEEVEKVRGMMREKEVVKRGGVSFFVGSSES